MHLAEVSVKQRFHLESGKAEDRRLVLPQARDNSQRSEFREASDGPG